MLSEREQIIIEEFLDFAREPEEKYLLDFQFSTGEATAELSKHYKWVLGVNRDYGVVNQANVNFKTPNASFLTYNLASPITAFIAPEYDNILCYTEPLRGYNLLYEVAKPGALLTIYDECIIPRQNFGNWKYKFLKPLTPHLNKHVFYK